MVVNKYLFTIVNIITICTSLTSCNAINRLKRIAKPPQFSALEIPQPASTEDIYSPTRRFERISNTNSLWQPGATTFFRDNRAWKVGDILRVIVQIQDSAKLDSSSVQQRRNRDSIGLNALFGLEQSVAKAFSGDGKSDSLIGYTRNKNHNGSGNISRRESIKIELAATVQKVLANGNLVIDAKQEMIVNSELRKVQIRGIARPQDIRADNSIGFTQIANAQILYGGDGDLNDLLTQPYGAQLIDAASPF